MALRHESQNINILLRNNPLGFGYEIIDRVDGKFKVIFRTSSKEQVEKIFDDLKTKDSLEINEKPIENFNPRLLIINEKHGDCHFIVRNIEELNLLSFKYLKREYESNMIQKWNIPEITITEDYIENCPDENVKKDLIQKRASQISNRNYNLHYNKMVDKLINAIESNSHNNIYNLLKHFYEEYAYLEDFNNDTL